MINLLAVVTIFAELPFFMWLIIGAFAYYMFFGRH